jgi:manganese efflux pump family protein
MSLLALLAWVTTAGGGLYLLAIWLIEYDKDFHAVAATRLPPPLLASHVVLAGGGLLVWAGYLVNDQDDLAWIAVAAILLAASAGATMAIRWIGVYKSGRAARRLVLAGQHGRVAVLDRPVPEGPPERNFPLLVVIAHGGFAAVTITLVLLSAFGS